MTTQASQLSPDDQRTATAQALVRIAELEQQLVKERARGDRAERELDEVRYAAPALLYGLRLLAQRQGVALRAVARVWKRMRWLEREHAELQCAYATLAARMPSLAQTQALAAQAMEGDV